MDDDKRPGLGYRENALDKTMDTDYRRARSVLEGIIEKHGIQDMRFSGWDKKISEAYMSSFGPISSSNPQEHKNREIRTKKVMSISQELEKIYTSLGYERHELEGITSYAPCQLVFYSRFHDDLVDVLMDRNLLTEEYGPVLYQFEARRFASLLKDDLYEKEPESARWGIQANDTRVPVHGGVYAALGAIPAGIIVFLSTNSLSMSALSIVVSGAMGAAIAYVRGKKVPALDGKVLAEGTDALYLAAEAPENGHKKVEQPKIASDAHDALLAETPPHEVDEIELDVGNKNGERTLRR